MSVDLTRLTAHLSPEQQEAVKKAYRKRAEHPTAAFLWCFFLGTCGAHRFYLRQWGAGLVRLIFPLAAAIVVVLGIVLQWPPASVAAVAIVLLLIALIWEIIDLFRIDHEVYERNLKLAEELIAGTLLADHGVEQKALGRMQILMEETEAASTAAAQREERQTAADAAAIVPEPVAAVSEAAAPNADEAEEVADARETATAGAGAATAQYVERTVNEISADPGETQHGGEPLYSPEHSWSESALLHAEDEQERTGEQSGEETGAEPGAGSMPGTLGEAAVGLGAAAVGGLAVDELVTRHHEETDHSATDSLETFTTVGEAESEQRDEAVAAEAETPETASTKPPTTAESEALTWPDHPPVQFDEPAPAAESGVWAPLAGAALAGAAVGGGAAVVAAEERSSAAPAPATQTDFTDMGTYLDDAPPVADIEGAAPLFVSLPEYADVTSAETPTLQVVPAPEGGPAADEALLLLVPDAAADQPMFAAEPLAAGEAAPPAESYIPPTVPVVSIPVATEVAPTEVVSGPIMPPASEPEPEPAPVAEPARSGGETLAELAGLAGGAGLALGAAEMWHTHEQSETPAEPAAAEPSLAQPAADEPEVAPLASTAPATVEEPAAASDVWALPTAPVAPVEPPRHQLRRIREYLKVKRGDQETEELVAEELIEVDQDPQPVRERLRAQLRQQAVERGLE